MCHAQLHLTPQFTPWFTLRRAESSDCGIAHTPHTWHGDTPGHAACDQTARACRGLRWCCWFWLGVFAFRIKGTEGDASIGGEGPKGQGPKQCRKLRNIMAALGSELITLLQSTLWKCALLMCCVIPVRPPVMPSLKPHPTPWLHPSLTPTPLSPHPTPFSPLSPPLSPSSPPFLPPPAPLPLHPRATPPTMRHHDSFSRGCAPPTGTPPPPAPPCGAATPTSSYLWGGVGWGGGRAKECKQKQWERAGRRVCKWGAGKCAGWEEGKKYERHLQGPTGAVTARACPQAAPTA